MNCNKIGFIGFARMLLRFSSLLYQLMFQTFEIPDFLGRKLNNFEEVFYSKSFIV